MQKLVFFLVLLLGACQPNDADIYPIRGIDVSHYQMKINWPIVGQQDISFVFMKATEGVDFQDSTFRYNWEQSKAVGLTRGAYHFFKPKMSVLWQFNNFAQLVPVEKGALPPVLDVEDYKGLSAAKLISKVSEWLILAEAHYHQKPIIYTYYNLYHNHLQAAFPQYVFWVAAYRRKEPPLDAKTHFWQYSDRQRVEGIRVVVDGNVWLGTKEEWAVFCEN